MVISLSFNSHYVIETSGFRFSIELIKKLACSTKGNSCGRTQEPPCCAADTEEQRHIICEETDATRQSVTGANHPQAASIRTQTRVSWSELVGKDRTRCGSGTAERGTLVASKACWERRTDAVSTPAWVWCTLLPHVLLSVFVLFRFRLENKKRE